MEKALEPEAYWKLKAELLGVKLAAHEQQMREATLAGKIARAYGVDPSRDYELVDEGCLIRQDDAIQAP